MTPEQAADVVMTLHTLTKFLAFGVSFIAGVVLGDW